MWDILIGAAASLLVGAAIGYGVGEIIDALSGVFVRFWNSLISIVKKVWGYVTEATQYYLASLSQLLDNNWGELSAYLREQLGYTKDWLAFLFKQGAEACLAFINPQREQGESVVFSLGVVQEDVQLPTEQNPMVTILEL